jgi:glycosyltransferase involved in cell wall biosynthesis
VCDDGSTDGSRAVIWGYVDRDPRIGLINKRNAGVASALNVAVRASRGDIICLLDADDSFFPQKLRRVVDTFNQTDWGLLVHPLLVVDEVGRDVQVKPAFTRFEKGWIANRNLQRGGR